MRLYERVVLANFAEIEAIVPLAFDFTADFRDMFEVRGTTRRNRGLNLQAAVNCDMVRLRYKGLDGVIRASTITFSEPPSSLDASVSGLASKLPLRVLTTRWLGLEHLRCRQPVAPHRPACAARLWHSWSRSIPSGIGPFSNSQTTL